MRFSLGLLGFSLAACSAVDGGSADLTPREMGPRPDLAVDPCLPLTPSTQLFEGHCAEATPCFRDAPTPGF